MKIKLTTEPCSDLSPDLLKKYNISIIPMPVILGDEERLDGLNITPDDIYNHVNKTGQLPKTAANNGTVYEEFFRKALEGYDAVIHISISSEISSSYQNATNGAKTFDNVFVVDGKSLSTGTGLLLLKAADLIEANQNATEIVETLNKLTKKVQASFVIETLDYLYKGGRCSMLKMLGANLFKIKPGLDLIDGKIVAGKKYKGKQEKVIADYVDHLLKSHTNPDLTRCFVTHTKMSENWVNIVIERAKKAGFKEVLETTAGCIITCHCGANTIGLLFINN